MEIEKSFFNTSDYELQTPLGHGAFGTVYIAKNIHNNKEYAAKIIDNFADNFDGHKQMLFLRESTILQILNHPAIVKFVGINFQSFQNSKLLQPSIITEYLKKGSLKNILDKERRILADHEWNFTKKYINLLGISDAMRYLHERGIVHRDLKPENILVDSNYYPRICDFGLSKCFSDSFTKSTKLTMSGQFGTPLYLPPEILRGEEEYNQSVDVYAFAMIAYEIITGKQPFYEFSSKSSLTILNKIIEGLRPTFTELVTEKMRNLLTRCWNNLPSERPTFDEIFNELSTDFSYFIDSVDKEEIQDYLDILKESKENSIIKHRTKKLNRNNSDNTIQQLKTQIKELETKLIKNDEKQSIIDQSNQINYEKTLMKNEREKDIELITLNDKLTIYENENKKLKKQIIKLNENDVNYKQKIFELENQILNLEKQIEDEREVYINTLKEYKLEKIKEYQKLVDQLKIRLKTQDDIIEKLSKRIGP